MSVQIALLRAVNVGGHAKISMAELRGVAEGLGLKKVRSLLQSGSLVFDAGKKSPSATEKLLKIACAKQFGVETDIHVRTPSELDRIVVRNPFSEEAKNDPGRLVVLFMGTAPQAKSFESLQAAIKGRECVRGDGRHAFIFYPDGQGRSKLTSAILERYLGVCGTARNWNAVLKLAALASE